MNELERLFAKKKTENGDDSYNTTGNNLLDILFMSEYFTKHLNEVHIGESEKEKLFSMFMRDPRIGMGNKLLGRELLYQSNVDYENIVKCGRFDDLLYKGDYDFIEYMLLEAKKGNELAKKWLPRLSGKDRELALIILKHFKITQKEYRKLIKVETTESKLSEKRTQDIEFEKVPSLAMLKYYNRFKNGEDTKNEFNEYLESVKKGTKDIKVNTTTVYDIYRNRNKIDADLFFDKIEKISIDCIPILDTSGSMTWGNDAIGKAMSIAHYLAKCSSYAKDYVVSFSSNPKLIKIHESFNSPNYFGNLGNSKYEREIKSMYTGDCSNTDLKKVMELLKGLEKMPKYIVILSDMEFDEGSKYSKDKLMRYWKEKGYETKIVWWNFNARNKTCPEMDEFGNIFFSGYNPTLLKYLQCCFDGNAFLDSLLSNYAKNLK